MTMRRMLPVLAMTAWLVSCGGGDGAGSAATDATDAPSRFRAALHAAAPVDAPAPSGARLVAPAAPADAISDDAAYAADQLMDFGELMFSEYFPGHPATGVYEGYLYRFYPATGTYLGVRDGGVYVFGGPFGSTVRYVGLLTQYITPKLRPTSVGPGPCVSTTAGYQTWATPSPTLGHNAAATVAGCSGPITMPQWVQTTGPAVALLSSRAQTISFEPPSAGTYVFHVSFVDADGVQRNESVSMAVASNDMPSSRLTLRVSQSVRMGGAVSVRAWPTLAAGDSVQSITWTQLEGPTVSLDTQDPRLAQFTAPWVGHDALIRLRATLRSAQGTSLIDDVAILVEHHEQAAVNDDNALWAGDHVSRVHAYRADGPYAKRLVGCVYDATNKMQGVGYNMCRLAQLPFVAQQTSGGMPTVEQIMDRVAVSHDWMGRNFETFLRTQDPHGDIRRMLNSVTAVVIGAQIRPSFYMPATGAIYLDAESFWLTSEERDTLNEAVDYRAGFGNGLKYETLWRYVSDGRSLLAYDDPEERIIRQPAVLRGEVSAVMSHELGHALDFLPPTIYPLLDSQQGVWSNLWSRYQAYLLTSDLLTFNHPLQSPIMNGLAQVNYFGAMPSAAERAYTPEQVAGFFSADLATDEYSYSNEREDLAMTLEEVLMSRRVGAQRDVAFVDPIAPDATSGTILVRWGQRGRAGDERIKPRARFLVRELVPWLPVEEVEALPAPQAMRAGESWYANLEIQSIPRRVKPLAVRPGWLEKPSLRRDMRHHVQHIPRWLQNLRRGVQPAERAREAGRPLAG
jgi:hypothetical protein